MTKIIVTGGSGLVGTALKEIVSENLSNNNSNNFEFVFLTRQDCDLRDRNSVIKLFQQLQPDVVVHLASHVGGVYDNMNNNFTYLVDNIHTNCNIVEACKHTKPQLLINMLSTCIFPDISNNPTLQFPLSSSQLHDGLPHYSNIGYAYSKRVLHIAGEILANGGTTRVVNIIPTNLYGEGDNYDIDAGHVIPALVHKTFLAKQSGCELYIRGSGHALRQFLYAKDLAKILYHFGTENVVFSEKSITFIASPPKETETSIRNVVEAICKEMDFRGPVVYQSNEPIGQISKTTSNTELEKYLPDFTFTSLDDGLHNTIRYFVKHYGNLRGTTI